MASVSINVLDPLPLPTPSQVRLVFALDIHEVHAALVHQAVYSRDQPRLISIRFDSLPRAKLLIADIIGNLADVALAHFPNWYGDRIPFADIDDSMPSFDSLLTSLAIEQGLLERGVSVAWLKAARKFCHAQKRPLPRDFTASVHIAQLALAIDPLPIVIALMVHDPKPDPAAVHHLARTSEWLARQSRARVLVVVPDALSRSTELDSISFEAIHIATKRERVEPAADSRSRVSVTPLIGYPNPMSRAEQLLAKRLGQDDMLSPLFEFNIQVATRNGNRYLVDLVWLDGRLVVEVDGYEFHSDRETFSRDRRRDYELMISGYLVLRLPQDEVVEDVELAVEKIRDLVQFRRRMGLPESEHLQ